MLLRDVLVVLIRFALTSSQEDAKKALHFVLRSKSNRAIGAGVILCQ